MLVDRVALTILVEMTVVHIMIQAATAHSIQIRHLNQSRKMFLYLHSCMNMATDSEPIEEKNKEITPRQLMRTGKAVGYTHTHI